MVTIQQIERKFDQILSQALIRDTLNLIGSSENFIKFLYRYARLREIFVPAICGLGAKVGRSSHLFLDAAEVFPALSKKSDFLASFILDSTKNEMKEAGFTNRTTHSCLSTAMLRGVIDYFDGKNPGGDVKRYAVNMHEGLEWIDLFHKQILRSYGYGTIDTLSSIFFSWGFHLAVQHVSDHDFYVLDTWIKNKYPAMVDFLQNRSFRGSGVASFPGYSWISINSIIGKGVCKLNFDAAMFGANIALKLLDEKEQEKMYDKILEGYEAYIELRKLFHKNVLK